MNQFLRSSCLGAYDANATEYLDTNAVCADPTIEDAPAAASFLPLFSAVWLAILFTLLF